MIHSSANSFDPDITIRWHDQVQFHYFILVDEATGEVGFPAIMQQVEADLCNTAFRISGSPWRWFNILCLNQAN